MNGLETIFNQKAICDKIAILGSSKSLSLFPKNFEGLKIAIGDVPFRAPSFGQFDYHISANTVWPDFRNLRNLSKFLKQPVTKFIFSTSNFSNMNARQFKNTIDFLEDSASSRYFFFDQRHFSGRLCDNIKGCCLAYTELNLSQTIQESLSEEFKISPKYSGSHSGFFHALAFSFLLKPNHLITYGVDLPMGKRKYRYFKPWKIPPIKKLEYLKVQFSNNSIFDEGRMEIFSDLAFFSELQNESGTSLHYTGIDSTLGKVPGIKLWNSF
jgi:hypothetical protein